MEEDSERLPDTLTPQESLLSPQENINLGSHIPWGRLIACRQFLKSVDLIEPFTFGRSEECSMIITGQNCSRNMLLNISKVHFQIEKSDEDDMIYITDFSKNGTFVNQVKIGNRKRKILKNDDTIAIAMKDSSIYVFLSLQAAEDFLPPILLPKYANIRRLGRGSCGEVRLVKDRDTFKQYAIKKILLGESNSSQIHKINHPTKIINEIQILRALVHPCVIQCDDIIQHEREVYLVLEYMSGGELNTRVLNGRMSEDLVKFYFLQLLSAVQYLHSSDVIHRDLKPENILLRDEGEETLLKITDFGLSKVSNASDLTTMCGTLRYVAPEVISKNYRECGEYGKKADIWSLGVILFFMISREYPFNGIDHCDLAKNIIRGGGMDMTSRSWTMVSQEAKEVIKGILRLQPKKRLQLTEIFTHNWLKNDFGVKYRVENLLQSEGLENPFQDLMLGPPEKKFKFSIIPYSNTSSSSSSDLESTLTYSSTSNYSNGSTMCY